VSVQVIVPSPDETQSRRAPFPPTEPILVSESFNSERPPTTDRAIGMLGIIVVAAIICFSVYSIVKYLF